MPVVLNRRQEDDAYRKGEGTEEEIGGSGVERGMALARGPFVASYLANG